MIISERGKFVFFANPKTGTTAIEAQLSPFAIIMIGENPNLKHMNVKRYERFVEPFMARLKINLQLDKIGVVRDPIDWLSSWYRYRAREALRSSQNSTYNISFETFIESYLQDERPEYAKVGSPCGTILNNEGKLAMDYLYAYENLGGLASDLSKRLGQDITFNKRLNISPAMKLELSPQLKTRLLNRFSHEMEIYENALR